MSSLDLTTYLPSASEITEEQVAASRAKIEALLADGVSPTPDTRPGSVLGDLIVSHMALADAARGEAARRLLSDLDTEQLENGVVYNCDIAKTWLSNFVRPGELRKTRGVVRLVLVRSGFYSDAGVLADGFLTLNRGIQFLFNTSDVFKVSLPYDDDASLRVIAPGESRPSGSLNCFMAEETEDGNLQVDLPVMGSSAGGVPAGSSGLVDWQLSMLVSVTAVTTFAAQDSDAGIRSQAARVRKTFYASSLSTRAGAAGMVLSEFGDATVVSPVTNGDAALTRGGSDTLLLIQKPCLDVYARSDVLLTGTVVVRVPVFELTGDSEHAGAAVFSFGHVPVDIVGFSLADNSNLDVGGEGAPTSGDSVSAWLVSTSRSGGNVGTDVRSSRELFSLCLRVHDDDLASVVTADDEVRVVVTYRYDPLLLQVASLVEAPRNAPAGVSVETRSFQPFSIGNLTVEYYRTGGKTVALGLAASEIVVAVNRTGWPDTLTGTAINDSMLYAGARGVRNVTASASLRPSVATHRYDAAGMPAMPTDKASWDAFVALQDEWPVLSVFAFRSLNPETVTTGMTDFSSIETYIENCGLLGVPFGNRILRWMITADELDLKEVVT